MSDDRDAILGRVRAALAGRSGRTDRPAFPDALSTAAGRRAHADDLSNFRANFETAAGRWLASPGDAVALLRAEGADRAYVDPRLPRALGEALASAGISVVRDYERSRADEIGAAFTPATAAVAETGSLVLTDADTSDRLAAVAPWVHVAVLEPGRVVATLAEMLRALPDDPNVVFVSGPSQTADVEGILIRGVHGPGIQACLPMAWRNPGERD